MIEKLMNQSLEDRLDVDLAKETLITLSYLNPSILKQIPKNLYQKITSLAALSKKDYYVDIEKPLEEQEISEDCKDLISIIYYLYVADDDEKRNLWNQWIQNEKKDD